MKAKELKKKQGVLYTLTALPTKASRWTANNLKLLGMLAIASLWGLSYSEFYMLALKWMLIPAFFLVLSIGLISLGIDLVEKENFDKVQNSTFGIDNEDKKIYNNNIEHKK